VPAIFIHRSVGWAAVQIPVVFLLLGRSNDYVSRAVSYTSTIFTEVLLAARLGMRTSTIEHIICQHAKSRNDRTGTHHTPDGDHCGASANQDIREEDKHDSEQPPNRRNNGTPYSQKDLRDVIEGSGI
jgi:hypothetical protein